MITVGKNLALESQTLSSSTAKIAKRFPSLGKADLANQRRKARIASQRIKVGMHFDELKNV
ncbi:MAG: hypothetical protein QOD84_2044 [Acidobacteriaceae bacterium]